MTRKKTVNWRKDLSVREKRMKPRELVESILDRIDRRLSYFCAPLPHLSLDEARKCRMEIDGEEALILLAFLGVKTGKVPRPKR